MLNKEKTDSELGMKILKHLKEKGVHTPGQFSNIDKNEQIETIRKNFEETMRVLGLDMKDDSLKDTPTRVAKMYVKEMFWGLNPSNFPKIKSIDNKMKYDEMVIELDISLQSNCEHHLLNIDGFAAIGYIPKDKVLGLSKINRIVEYFSKRPQIQERLTAQIYHALQFILETDNVAVFIDARHFCVKYRGVEDVNSSTVTSKLGGIFKSNIEVRQEFINLMRK